MKLKCQYVSATEAGDEIFQHANLGMEGFPFFAEFLMFALQARATSQFCGFSDFFGGAFALGAISDVSSAVGHGSG